MHIIYLHEDLNLSLLVFTVCLYKYHIHRD